MSDENTEEQFEMFDIPPDEQEWEKEWNGMPEYYNKRIQPFKTIFVHFRTEEDYREFTEIIDQKMTLQTKSIWHPELMRGVNGKYRWVNEDES